MQLSKQELDNRRVNFCAAMDEVFPDWDTAVIISKVNQYYFTGTVQDALLLIPRGGEMTYHVRRSCERAELESPLDRIYPMQSYRDAAQRVGAACGNTYLEKEVVTCAMLERLQTYFRMNTVGSLDRVVRMVRAVKSPYELYWMERAGGQHDLLLRQGVPPLLREGMSEAEFIASLFKESFRYGHDGITRFHGFQTEIACGQIAFGENSLFPTSFNGPGGERGRSPAIPVAGSGRRLKKGDLVFVDIGFGHNGYNTDATQVYCFGAEPSREALEAHRLCMDIERRVARQLMPGAVPSRIYHSIMADLGDERKRDFMGFGSRAVQFLGHGIGLQVDELPVIARGFEEPLEENMAFAIEPKKGIAGAGMVGVEDTYVVTATGGRCITGGNREIIIVNQL